MKQLPEAYLERMHRLLGDEMTAFLDAMERPARHGIRHNPLKCSMEALRRALPFALPPEPTLFSPLNYEAPDAHIGLLAAHHSGMFYSQEPSASCAVTVLDPQPGERILDLCAAPGGKSSQIAALTGDDGLLWANEIIRSRAQILSFNLERMGISNTVISSCHPDILCKGLAGYFDRVLVDAPCSGEGMFRRDAQSIAQWTPDLPRACAQRQAQILDSAAQALRPGGVLVYSTCTFSREENEETVEAFLLRHPEFSPDLPASITFGRPAENGMPGRRIYPMDGGEGHFVARLRKRDDAPASSEKTQSRRKKASPAAPPRSPSLVRQAQALYEACFSDAPRGVFVPRGEYIFLSPEALPLREEFGILRAGCTFAQIVGQSLQPCHGAFMCRRAKDCLQSMDFAPEDPTLSAFLRGEEIFCPPALNGYTAVTVSGTVTGFGKAVQGKLKNKYPKGLRNPKQ